VSIKYYFTIFILLLFGALVHAQSNNAYVLSRNDGFVVPLSLTAMAASMVFYYQSDLNLTVTEIGQLDRMEVNPLDRGATYNWNPAFAKASDIMMVSMATVPVLAIVPMLTSSDYKRAFTYTIMGAEVVCLVSSLAYLSKTFAARTRPYLYNTNFTADERFAMQGYEAPRGKTSFFSGHTTIAFASAVFFSETWQAYYGKNTLSRVIWGGTLTAAAFTGYAGVKSGHHFITDVLTGAAAGCLTGYLVPKLHQTSSKISISVLPQRITLVTLF
jgi:membrane-associated phospholipid phosphatase